MKAIVDADTCTGCRLCVELCPKVFEMNGNIAVTKRTIVPEDAERSCHEAAENCPVDAISVE